MEFTAVLDFPDIFYVKNSSADVLISNGQSALDLLSTARYDCGAEKLILDKADIVENFFDLKTLVAGEVLQKFVNYGMPVAIVGDFSVYDSKSLKDFIYECNKGKNVFFVPDFDLAVAKLTGK